MRKPVFRFAPSPNGELHLGHALSALTNQHMAGRAGGRLLLRIEDIDVARCKPEFETGIFRDLDWLGVAWEEPVRRQSQNFADYAVLLDRLIHDELVYPAFMSRGEMRAHISEAESRGKPWPRDPDGVPLYPDADKALSRGERKRRIVEGIPYAWRLDMAAAAAVLKAPLTWTEFSADDMASTRAHTARPQEWGDVALARREVPTSYHLSVVADDALQGVTHVVRGHDLYAATSVQRMLQQLLGLPQPAYFHHRLVLGQDGRKLSKSLGDSGIRRLREAGRTPADVRQMVGF